MEAPGLFGRERPTEDDRKAHVLQYRREEGEASDRCPSCQGPATGPWSHSDMKILHGNLPDIGKGADNWIRIFEGLTAQDGLAFIALRALLSAIVGVEKLHTLEKPRKKQGARHSPLRPVP
ncbi:hypothetical protein NHX12_011050 [Muraenolepis orangiensis]|uniref:Uncharacterized protein n=1 Tax=Muraenolepis orangiensis TaxID=630683 RepID=A0A9Q0DFD9_9TELE|nr:hypothetical protein NHX12_011050 [Muraenolepis orangiensis]